MNGHADTIRRIRNQLPADVARDFDALLAENQRLQEERDEWERIAVRTSVEAGNEIRRIRAEALAGEDG